MSSDFRSELKDMLKVKDDNDDVILEAVKLMTSKDKDLPLKTEIHDPLSFSLMGSLAEYLKQRGMFKSAKFIKTILDNYATYMVSKDRKSREEVIEMIKEISKQKSSPLDRLLHGGESNVG